MVERFVVRALVAGSLCLALVVFLVVPIPSGDDGDPTLPAAAFEQVGIYRLEISLLVFYGLLLLITPAFSGLIRGRLPIEISTRGAKFIEKSAALDEARISELERSISAHTEKLANLNFDIGRLQKMSESDSSQPTVRSKK